MSGGGEHPKPIQGDRGDAGGEVTMSIEETNKLRASLGLAPLKADATPSGPSEEVVKQREAEESAAKAQELAARVSAARERRRQQELLSATRTLGEAATDVDDVMSWVGKSRKAAEERNVQAQMEAKRRAAEAAARASRQAAESEDDEEGDAGGGGLGAAELAGVRVMHSAEELEEGGTMILTLEDKGILDDRGELREEEEDDVALENVLARENKQRAKAFRDSRKTAKPLWEEDGVRRGILDKYDQEEEEALQIDAAGKVQLNGEDRQSEVRAKLAAAAAGLRAAAAAAPPTFTSGGDFFTAEEMASLEKPRKKKERRLKKRVLTEEELEELAAGASAQGGGGGSGGGDLGSRADREARAGQRASEQAQAVADKRARFEAALTKANYASAALRQQMSAVEGGEGEEEEEDEDLYRSLNKARQLAQKAGLPALPAAAAAESLAEQLSRRREGNGGAAPPLPDDSGALTFTDVAEFARTIVVTQEGTAAAAVRVGEEVDVAAAAAEVAAPAAPNELQFDGVEGMDVERQPTAATAAPAVGEAPQGRDAAGLWGSWVPAGTGGGGDEGGDGDGEEPAGPVGERRRLRRKRQWEEDDEGEDEGEDEGRGAGGAAAGVKKEEPGEDATGLANEKAIGRGVAGALAFLKERGELERPVEWAGRTMDSRNSYFTAAMAGFRDVYSGGRTEDKVALDVELALTRKDEYGRVLTPKEAFRQLCHRFHGIKPSKNTREKRSRQVVKEMAQRKAATGDVEADLMAGARAVQQATAAPYIVLSGTVRPGQSRDATSGHATVEHGGRAAPTALTPVLGGGQAPLVGRAKVEAMLGIKRPASGGSGGGGGAQSMPPPPSRAPRRT